MNPMTKAFAADIHGFVVARGLELVHFAKGQRKGEPRAWRTRQAILDDQPTRPAHTAPSRHSPSSKKPR
jgi:hypothetical protein